MLSKARECELYSSAAHLSMSTRFFGVGEEIVLESDIKSVTNTRWRQLIHTHMWKSALVLVSACSHWAQACQEVGPCCGSRGFSTCFETQSSCTSGRFISHRWIEIRIDERPHSGNRFQTITSICERSDCSTWNRASRWGTAGFDVLSCH